jgi:hypothetical protein
MIIVMTLWCDFDVRCGLQQFAIFLIVHFMPSISLKCTVNDIFTLCIWFVARVLEENRTHWRLDMHTSSQANHHVQS